MIPAPDDAPEGRSGQTPILAGVVGWPVAHSLSPLIHTIWARRAGIAGHYLPVAAPPAYDDFARIIDALRVVGFAGVNVTLPHKEHALRYADAATPAAKAAGAANMLTFFSDGARADNSDIDGFAEALKAVRPQPDGAALVLGAGGAARAVVLALKKAGVREVVIANRTRARADAIANDLGAGAVDWAGAAARLESADILVNATSLGMTGQPPLTLDLAALPPGAAVADIVYAPLETALLKAARERGCAVIDGLAMLMHQAAPGFRAWFGGPAAADADLREALVFELGRRGRA